VGLRRDQITSTAIFFIDILPISCIGHLVSGNHTVIIEWHPLDGDKPSLWLNHRVIDLSIIHTLYTTDVFSRDGVLLLSLTVYTHRESKKHRRLLTFLFQCVMYKYIHLLTYQRTLFMIILANVDQFK